ncbi:MAG: hypothetical protein R3D67_14185 [Hyphomicrobiaceae bacterium]
MKLRAIRVAEVGRFMEPAAVEGLSGGLDLLVGSNEAGKSTLLKAARLALREKHTSTRAEIRELRPYGGGAPLVEVEFEAGGERWRLRKRYLAEKAAELVSLGSNRIARGADVDTALDTLFGAESISSRLSLLWLEQGSLVTAPAAVPEAGRDLVHAAVTAEIANAAGGAAVRRMRREIAALLDAQVTKTGLRKNGGLAVAERRLAGAKEALAVARRRAEDDEALVEQLVRVETEAQALRAPEAAHLRQRRLAAAEAQLQAGRANAARRDAAAVAEADARRRHEQAASALRHLTDALDQIERVSRETETYTHEAVRLGAELATAQKLLDDAEKLVRARQTEFAVAEADLARLRAAQAWRELAQAGKQAQAAAKRLDEIARDLAALPQDDKLLGDARKLVAAIAGGKARVEAQAPIVTVDYEPDAIARITHDGSPVGDGMQLVAQGKLELSIAGVGRITVMPSHSGDHAAMVRSLACDHAALEALLATANVADAATLEARREAARVLEAERGRLEGTMTALAPEGLAALLDRVRAAEAHLAKLGSPTEPVRTLAEMGDAVVDLRAQCERAGQARDGAAATLDQLAREQAAAGARLQGHEERLAQLRSQAPPADDAARMRSQHEDEAEAASLAYSEALRIHAALKAEAPDAAGLARMENEVTTARREIEAARERLSDLMAQRSRLEGGLEQARREDRTGQLEELIAEVEQAQRDYDDIAEDVAALKLLDDELAREDAALRSAYQVPVAERLAPYLELLFPGGSVALDDKFETSGLVRADLKERMDDLSAGTREQIAVIVRLGFARLLADQGMSWPLVLDDALVHSDDWRILAMHRALERAAQSHQVIVLTSREQTFGNLAGNRVSVGPWLQGP